MFPFLIEFESKGRSTTRFDRNALRLSVWHFDFFCFTVLETDHAGIFAFRAEEGKVLQPVCGRSCVRVLPPHLGQHSQSVLMFSISATSGPSVLPGDQRTKRGVTVKAAFRKAGNFLDGLADADAEARQDLPDLPVGVGQSPTTISVDRLCTTNHRSRK